MRVLSKSCAVASRVAHERFFRRAIVSVCAITLTIGGTIHPAMAAEAAAGICRNDSSSVFKTLDQVYRREEFRIIYTTQGEHALVSTADRNANGTPDQVEDVATQLIATRRIYSDIIGLDPPLDMPRYARAQSIDVFLFDMKGGNGLGYDEVVNYRLAFDGSGGRCTLRIDLSSRLGNQNVTPAHELFHLHQYAYSMFKARWFLEGTARWAEYALRAGTGPGQSLPQTKDAIEARLFFQTYQAELLWNRLAGITDPVGRLPLSQDLTQAEYLDGSIVIHDDALHGVGFMKALLEALDSQSAEIATRKGWNRYNWAEADQTSPEQNQEILQAVIRAFSRSIEGQSAQTPEIETFLNAGSESAMSDRPSAAR